MKYIFSYREIRIWPYRPLLANSKTCQTHKSLLKKAYLEVANFLSKGFTNMNIRNCMVKYSLHDAEGMYKMGKHNYLTVSIYISKNATGNKW